MLKYTILLVGLLAIVGAALNIPHPPVIQAHVANEEAVPANPQGRASSCPLMYSCYQNRTYYFDGNNKRTRDQAFTFCASLNMTMLSVENCDKNTFIVESIKRMGCATESYWTAGYQNGNKSWFWSNTGRPMNYTNWKFDEPNYNKNQNCVAIRKEYLQWTDKQCSEKYNTICESSRKC